MYPQRSFFLSLLLGNLLLIVAVLGVGFLVALHEANRQSSGLIGRFQERLLMLVLNDLQESWPNVDERIRQYCDSYAKEPNFRLTVLDAQGRVLGDSGGQPEKMEAHLTADRPEILAALEGKRGESVRKSKTNHIDYRYLAKPVLVDGQPVAVVRVAFPAAGFMEIKRLFVRGTLLGFLMLLLVAVALTLLLGWLWYKPLRFLNDEARRIAEGDLAPSPPIEGPREITQLFHSLETMRQTVSRQLNTITRQREGLQTILRNLPDSIFAMNPAAQVIYFNDAARKLFRIDSTTERPFLQELIRNAAIVEWYLACRRHLAGTPAQTEYRPNIERKEVDLFGRRHFLELEFVETENTAPNDAACILIVSDLSESVRANKMKTDFVANASHELRTPLAAIRAALDNIAEDVYNDRETLEKIIRIVDRHVSRLNALIEDLLDLQGTEDETVSPSLEETCVAEQQLWIEELFQKRVAEKKLAFSVVSDFGDATFRVDGKKLGLILQNLIDNAVKFTPANGTISLTFGREEGSLVLRCRDTGCGIAVEEQQRIFERFYQGDSSRTGDSRVRGTGLGLAIVKHAVERLKGSISLESQMRQGSVFTVRIPIDPTSGN